MWDYIESPYLIKRPVPWHSPIMWKYILAYHFKHRISEETEVAPCLFDFPVQTHLFKQAPWDFCVILLGGVQKAFLSWKPQAGWWWPPSAHTPSPPPAGCPLQLSCHLAGHEMHLWPGIPCSILLQVCPPRVAHLLRWYLYGPTKVTSQPGLTASPFPTQHHSFPSPTTAASAFLARSHGNSLPVLTLLHPSSWLNSAPSLPLTWSCSIPPCWPSPTATSFPTCLCFTPLLVLASVHLPSQACWTLWVLAPSEVVSTRQRSH